MDIREFKSIVMTFADPDTFVYQGSRILFSVNDDPIDAEVSMVDGNVHVIDSAGRKMPAHRWILRDLAKIELLASRLVDQIPPTPNFVSPSASVLPSLNRDADDRPKTVDDAAALMRDALGEDSPFETTVWYITSDAGEGKTSLINEVARIQARLFLDRRTDRLLVPIPLGGRSFLRFDDVTAGVLQNRYRYPFLYYNSFLALVRMGAIVPAYDGFEEMFVENGTGEAFSALGSLVGALDSRGKVILAVRKAYFDFDDTLARERLFDSIREHSVGFGKVALNRWDRSIFIRYCDARKVPDSAGVYSRISERLGSDHSVLTRAVLVKRLVKMVLESSSLDEILDGLNTSSNHFFASFVRSLIEREATEKWVDRSGKDGGPGVPLLSVDEHMDLLAQIALYMWDLRVDYLSDDNLDFVADYYSGSTGKPPAVAAQIRNRIRDHALLVKSSSSSNAREFDHDEFRLFFLGYGVSKQIVTLDDKAIPGIHNLLRKGSFPKRALDTVVCLLTSRDALDRLALVAYLIKIAGIDSKTSYSHETAGNIVIRLLDGIDGQGFEIANQTFGDDALRDLKLKDLHFRDCYFASTNVASTEISNCSFVSCRFAKLKFFASTRIERVLFDECSLTVLAEDGRESECWDPVEIKRKLRAFGVSFKNDVQDESNETDPATGEDPRLKDAMKFFRIFYRNTHVVDSVIVRRMRGRANAFSDETLPLLIRHGIVEEIPYDGGGQQRRFRLHVPMRRIQEAGSTCGGSFDAFLEKFSDRIGGM